MENALYDSLSCMRKLTRSFSDTIQLVNKNCTRAFSMDQTLFILCSCAWARVFAQWNENSAQKIRSEIQMNPHKKEGKLRN